jgi:hypothetical protein
MVSERQRIGAHLPSVESSMPPGRTEGEGSREPESEDFCSVRATSSLLFFFLSDV